MSTAGTSSMASSMARNFWCSASEMPAWDSTSSRWICSASAKIFSSPIAGLQEARMMGREPASTMSDLGNLFKASISLHASV